VSGSVLQPHTSGLASAGLIKQRREGCSLFYVVDNGKLPAVISFLQQKCCADEQ